MVRAPKATSSKRRASLVNLVQQEALFDFREVRPLLSVPSTNVSYISRLRSLKWLAVAGALRV